MGAIEDSGTERDPETTVILDGLGEEATVLLDTPDADLGATLLPGPDISATPGAADVHGTATVLGGDLAGFEDVTREDATIHDADTVVDALTIQEATVQEGTTANESVTIHESHPSRTTGPRLAGGFDLSQVLGEGGMGVVHLARQNDLRRDVAIKTLRGEFAGRPHERQSFLAESLVTGALEHPNVVPIHAVSENHDGELWLVMKRIQGRTLTELLEGQPETRDQDAVEHLLRIVLSVCNALAFAHAQGVLHRDIKPDNIMIGAYGEVLLVDWGIAVRYRDLDESSPLAEAPLASDLRKVAGTPRFMPPEMARGEGDRQGPWSDTHLVGGLIYEIFAGRPPHEGSTLREVLTNAQSIRPQPLPPDAPEPLRALCRRALSPNTQERFQTVEDLQEALEDYLDHRESIMLSTSAREQMEGWQRQYGADQEAQVAVENRAAQYRKISQAIASYRHSALLWPENTDAVDGEREGRLLMARAALEAGDLGIAQNNIDGLDTPEVREISDRITAARGERQGVANFARRLGSMLIAIQALVLAALAAFATNEVRRFTDSEILEQLRRLMPAVSLALESAETPSSEDLDEIANRLGRAESLGIALVDASGTVLADSTTDPVGLDAVEVREEIRDALEIGEGSAIFRSPDQDDVISLAARWRHEAAESQGVLILSLPRSVLRNELQPLLLATSAALLLTFLVSCLVTLRATRLLRESLARAL